ncbi:MAG: tripartite tricarboxylate transporter permease, partial [Dehalococcoidia bacterium]|nr:tripartite tricarboxylate transporter permease [Dehalococcoidia bacterium]
LAPLILIFATIGAYALHQNIMDVVAAFMLAILGYGAKHLGYNRAAIILGFVLGSLAEKYFLISINAYGLAFITRPINYLLIAIMIATIMYEVIRKNRHGKK